jgi:uncharacterized protein (TIGR02646 family)
MLELQHRSLPPLELNNFVAANPVLTPDDFDSELFQHIKKQVKASLHQDQGGLCVYCETTLTAIEGQIDHIKPKGQNGEYAHLTFVYTNFAHSCICNKTCGQKKKAGLLPIEPGPGCNDQFMLSTDGDILPLPHLTRAQRHPVAQTLQMLGLESRQSPWLVAQRKEWIEQIKIITEQYPQQLPAFLADLADKPFRHILQRLFA